MRTYTKGRVVCIKAIGSIYNLAVEYVMCYVHWIYRSIPKGRPSNASFLKHPSRSENKSFLRSDAQNISDFFDLEAYPASFIWPAFGNTTERIENPLNGYNFSSSSGRVRGKAEVAKRL
jgi:hypothetical protein